jgi:hypothetical protein
MEVLGCGEFLLRFGPLGGKTREISFLFFLNYASAKKKKKALSQLGKMQKPGEGLENGYCGMSKVAAKKKRLCFSLNEVLLN